MEYIVIRIKRQGEKNLKDAGGGRGALLAWKDRDKI
jgi:hypothetical protein